MSEQTLPHVTTADFDARVLKAATPTVVDFSATWCQPCKRVTPLLADLAPALSGRVDLVELDADSNREIAIRYGVRSMPTLIAFRDGEPVAHLVGAASREKLLEFLERVAHGS